MPISGPSTYPATVREFIEHWGEVEEVVGAGNLMLPEGTTLPQLENWRDLLDDLRDEVTDAGVDRTVAREDLNSSILSLRARLIEFNARVRSDFAGKAFARSLNEAFAIGDGEAGVRQSLRAMERLWTKINAMASPPVGVTLPMTLLGGYTLAGFEMAREALRSDYGALSAVEVDLRVAREERNDMQDIIYPVLKAYRMKVPASLPAGHALIDSLPALTPSTEGHTPDAVTASGVWNAGTGKADLTWTESTDSMLAEYQVRGVPGEVYDSDDEVVIATVPAGGARAFATDFALGSPGAVATFKVFVVLTMGRERGSDAVVVLRPG
ncbi:MAG: hypothetical protein ABMA13_02635 [Chthoniobacteraceae bacterium]